EPPSLISAIGTPVLINRTIIPFGLSHYVQTLVVLHVPDLQVVAVLGHRPSLTGLTWDANTLLDGNPAQVVFGHDFQTQITVHRPDRVIARAVTDDIELLIVAGLSAVAVKSL